MGLPVTWGLMLASSTRWSSAAKISFATALMPASERASVAFSMLKVRWVSSFAAFKTAAIAADLAGATGAPSSICNEESAEKVQRNAVVANDVGW